MNYREHYPHRAPAANAMFHTCVTLSMGFTLGMGLCLILSKGMTQMAKGRCKLPQYSQTHKLVNLQSFWGDTSYCVDKRYLKI